MICSKLSFLKLSVNGANVLRACVVEMDVFNIHFNSSYLIYRVDELQLY